MPETVRRNDALGRSMAEAGRNVKITTNQRFGTDGVGPYFPAASTSLVSAVSC